MILIIGVIGVISIIGGFACSLLVQSMIWASLGNPDVSPFNIANFNDLPIQCYLQ